jgi:hypothetical protein
VNQPVPPRKRTLSDLEINRYAMFLPYLPAEENNDAEAMPCIVLGSDEDGNGGVQVYAYSENGVVRISVHTYSAGPDENGDGPWAYYDQGHERVIPVVIDVYDAVPVGQATAEVNPLGQPLWVPSAGLAYAGVPLDQIPDDGQRAAVARHREADL